MIIHQEELAFARAYQQAHAFENLTDDQLRAILTRGRELFHWFKAHPRYAQHHQLSRSSSPSSLPTTWRLMELPGCGFHAGPRRRVDLAIARRRAVAGSVHSYLQYSLSVFSCTRARRTHRLRGQGPAREGSTLPGQSPGRRIAAATRLRTRPRTWCITRSSAPKTMRSS